MIKRFVLDTNILLEFPRAMAEDFADNTVIICGTVLQELNAKKTADGEIGYNAREAGRILDAFRKTGDLLYGVPTPSGGQLVFAPNGVKQENLPEGFSISSPDNRILSACVSLNKRDPKNPVILVTSDVLMRLSATACGIETQEFRKVMVEESSYDGHTTIDVAQEKIDELYKEKHISAEFLPDPLYENEFITLTAGSSSALSVYKKGALNLLPQQNIGWIRPKNALQSYAMWALTRPAEELPLVILEGPAGVAKTFLSIAAGLSGTYNAQKRTEADYYKMIITRPVADAFDGGQGTGYLPGGLEDKLHYLYQSYYDNLGVILRGGEKEDETQIQKQIDDMIEDGVIEVGSLAFIRGRSLMNTYLICDEAQNASKTLIRDVITRAGTGTKIVIAGDPSQIDVPTLSKRNNGLVTAADYMKGSPLCAYIRFGAETSVRSPLAKEAIRRMDW